MLLVFFFFRIYIYWTNIRFILRYFKSKLCRLFNFLIANLYLYLDNSLTGESFPASTINPMTMLGDEIINGKLVKNTLSGNFKSLSGKKLIQQVPELLLFHQWMTKHRYGNININRPSTGVPWSTTSGSWKQRRKLPSFTQMKMARSFTKWMKKITKWKFPISLRKRIQILSPCLSLSSLTNSSKIFYVSKDV